MGEREGAGVVTLGCRPAVSGKFLSIEGRKLRTCGVTYGTFAPSEDGSRYPSRATVDADLSAIATCGANAIRVYTPPPIWLLDAAMERGLRVMVGLAWEQHVAFLESRPRARKIVDDIRRQVASVAGHPAVLCLALGNEIPAQIVRWHGPRRIEAFIERLGDAAREEDDGALLTYVNYPSTEYLELPGLDLVAFNVFLESSSRFEAYVARLHNIAGDRPLLITEIGLDAGLRGEAAQARLVSQQVSSALAAGCTGAFVFSWTDDWHRGEEQVTGWAFGLTDGSRRPKPALWAVRSVFRRPPPRPGEDAPSVSVVVCSHNGAATIGDCLAGISRLDYPSFETIVVDDGSTDATAEVADELGVRVIRVAHGGLGAARNVGLAAAAGEIVAYVDDDAVPDPDWLSFAVFGLLESDHAGVGGPNIAPNGAGGVARAVAKAPGGPTHVLLSDRLAEHIPGCNMVFRKDALEAVGGFDPRFEVAGDDVDICWQLQERGSTLGFSPAAMVWHKRRSSLQAYLRQQRQYGRAEALLERKWPAKYNRGGHLSWAGRVYGAAQRPGRGDRRRIRYGSWGENLFQSVYDEGPGMPGLLPLMPEWYLLIALFAVLSGYELIRGPLVSVPGVGLSGGVVLLAVSVAALFLQAFRAGWSATHDRPLPRGSRVYLAGLIALLFVLQPLARLSGRLRHGLTPWRRRGRFLAGLPLPRRQAIWSETWGSARERLLALEAQLRPNCMVALRGGEYDRWDLDVRLGALAAARARMTIEEHGGGKQLIRFRIWPRLPAGTVAAFAATCGAAVALAVTGNGPLGLAVGTAALALAYRALRECGAAVAAIVQAANHVGADATMSADEGSTPFDWTEVYIEPIRQALAAPLLEEVEVDV